MSFLSFVQRTSDLGGRNGFGWKGGFKEWGTIAPSKYTKKL